MRFRALNRFILLIVSAAVFLPTVAAQGNAKHDAAIAESAQVQMAQGGTTIQVAMPYDAAFEKALDFLKRNEQLSIDIADKEAGTIATSLIVTGHWHQTGTRLELTFLKDSDKQTSIRIVVAEQKRYKALQTEPWGTAKANVKKSAQQAAQMQSAFASATSPVTGPGSIY